MINETLSVVLAGLRHNTYGVNAQIASVPRVPGDSAPPAVVTFVSEITDGTTARGEAVPPYPSIGVQISGATQMSGEIKTYERISHVPMLIHLSVMDSQSQRAVRNAGYLMRAVYRSLRDLMRNVNVADRTIGSVVVWAIQDQMQQYQINAPVQDGPVTVGLTLTLEVHDANP